MTDASALNREPFGIPTFYNGVWYRSRLEARWSAFFHHEGWTASYEPYDLPNWIPDFTLQGYDTHTDTAGIMHNVYPEIFVEIKPSRLLGELVDLLEQDFHVTSLVTSLRNTEHWGKEILLLGNAPVYGNDSNEPNCPWFGILGTVVVDEHGVEDYWFEPAPCVDLKEDGLDFFHYGAVWNTRIHGHYYGGQIWGYVCAWEKLLSRWQAAGNAVQWKGLRKDVFGSAQKQTGW